MFIVSFFIFIGKEIANIDRNARFGIYFVNELLTEAKSWRFQKILGMV